MKRTATYYFLLLGTLNLLLLMVMKQQAEWMPRVYNAIWECKPLPIMTEWLPSVWWWPGVLAFISFSLVMISLISDRWKATLRHVLILLIFIQSIFSWIALTGYFLPFIPSGTLNSLRDYDWLFRKLNNSIYSDHNIDRSVGEQVVLFGELIDHKNPMIHGVHVGYPLNHDENTDRNLTPEERDNNISELISNHAVVYKMVWAEGVLIRVVQESPDPFAPNYGTNIWLKLVNPLTGDLAEFQIIQ